VIRNAKEKELADSDSQHIASLVIEFPLAQHSNPVIEKAAIAQDREQDAVEQGPVWRGKTVAMRVTLYQRVRIMMALGPRSQGRDGSAADILIGHLFFGLHSAAGQEVVDEFAPLLLESDR